MARSVLLLVAVVLAAQASSDAGGTPRTPAWVRWRAWSWTRHRACPSPGPVSRCAAPCHAPPVLTDAAGAFEFPTMVPGGVYSVDVQRDGYRSSTFPDNSTWVRQPDAPIGRSRRRAARGGDGAARQRRVNRRRRARRGRAAACGGASLGAGRDVGGAGRAGRRPGGSSVGIASPASRRAPTSSAPGCGRPQRACRPAVDRIGVPACYPNATHRDHPRRRDRRGQRRRRGNRRAARGRRSDHILDLGVTRADGEAVTFATGHAMSLLDRTSYVLRVRRRPRRCSRSLPGEFQGRRAVAERTSQHLVDDRPGPVCADANQRRRQWSRDGEPDPRKRRQRGRARGLRGRRHTTITASRGARAARPGPRAVVPAGAGDDRSGLEFPGGRARRCLPRRRFPAAERRVVSEGRDVGEGVTSWTSPSASSPAGITTTSRSS